MKKLLLNATLSVTALTASGLQAHELWLNVPPVAAGNPLHIEMGYGENFPHGEPIPKARQALFAPLQVVGSKGIKAEFPITSEQYRFSQNNTTSGSWLVTATYKPAFWSLKPNGEKYQWRQSNKAQWPGSYCIESTMNAKTVSYVGAPGKNAALTQPTGARLEWVPQVDPAMLKTGDTLDIVLLANGKPLANHEVGIAMVDLSSPRDAAVPHAHHHHHHSADPSLSHPALAHTYAYENAAMKDRTDSSGKLSLPILKAGQWLLMTANDTPYEDKAVCDIHLDQTTFGFSVPE
ncbi:DUF4198 domain-containing protein [Mixta hanseatica]|uniref:DUF4198 domain-containing protein n=1 Tax=Mixta hanseatica TaxID=2872648 RepID=A0ABY4RC43_9GAMM|nr:DUF4198 domain-containing protein [Mixta hanseatica]UQY45744.1 DUF4198 domain-containing protein [Mixta hanseatica]